MGQQLHIYLVLLLSGCCVAGPVRDEAVSSSPMAEDVCTVKNVTFAKGEVVPDVAPCETCTCEAPEVKCSKVKCQQNNGCKIIQQSGKCCPEYKCTCEHEGKVYNNGEKLENPSSPCQVCYCRGGEIMCNSITCYRRDDCEPQHVAGHCCPKYGHCPPKNSSNVVAFPADPSGLSTKREMQPWLLTKSVNLQTTETPRYPQTIRIVEILPTEDRARTGEVSLLPRIITNGSPDSKPTSATDAVTGSYVESSSSSEASADLVVSPEQLAIGGKEEYVQPDSETYTTLLLHMVDVTTTYEELAAIVNGVTEGSGYDIETGGIYFSRGSKKDSSSEESEEGESREKDATNSNGNQKETTNLPNDNTRRVENRGQLNQISANMEVEDPTSGDEGESTENTPSITSVSSQSSSTSSTSSSQESSKLQGMVTRHGFTIPPILNLNHQLHHLTLGGTEEDLEEKSVVHIGVYDPKKSGEASNTVTVIKENSTPDSTIASSETATTQILLTPQDLKTLAEMIIKEKIKSSNEKLILDDSSSTPLPTESYEETSVSSPVELVEDDNTTTTTRTSGETKIEETKQSNDESRNIKSHNLTKEEEKAQAIIDRLTSNIVLPLEGIELVYGNDTTTTNPPVEVVPTVRSEVPIGNKDAEWAEVLNSTGARKMDEAIELETSSERSEQGSTELSDEIYRTSTARMRVSDYVDDASTLEPKTNEESTKHVETGKPRGSLRQMDNMVLRPENEHTRESANDRKVRVKASEDLSQHVPMASLDERDLMLVENFFKNALDFQ